jgi:DNA-binding NarL/FixJ family response regulator
MLLVGDADRREFRQARDELTALGRVRGASDVETAAAMLEAEEAAVDVIVLAQARPGEFSHAEIERLRQSAPLARIVGLLGSWCEGEMRSGRPWPAVVRTYWHQWPARADRELRRLAAGRRSAWALPITATEEERLLADATEPLPMRSGLIAISSRSYAMADWLAAACRHCGYSTVWLRPPRPVRVRGAAAVLMDGSRCRGEQCDELRQLAAATAPAPLVALLDFPRIEDVDRARCAGAAAVLSKPFQVEDLFWHLDRVTQPD